MPMRLWCQKTVIVVLVPNFVVQNCSYYIDGVVHGSLMVMRLKICTDLLVVVCMAVFDSSLMAMSLLFSCCDSIVVMLWWCLSQSHGHETPVRC